MDFQKRKPLSSFAKVATQRSLNIVLENLSKR